MARGIWRPEAEPDDVGALNTLDKTNLVAAINEVDTNQKADAALIAKTLKVVHCVIGDTDPVAIAALPSGAIIVGVQANVTEAYPVDATLIVGDHSGGSGALAASAISTGTGITATATGDYLAPVYKTPVGALQVAVGGSGDNSTGAATVLIHYIDA